MGITAVTKNGRACWQVQVIRDGKRIRRYLDRKKYLHRDAASLEREIHAELDARRGECLAPAASNAVVAPKAVTFAAFAERYLTLQDPARSDHRNKVRNVQLHLIPAFGEQLLTAINRAAIDEYRATLRRPSPATAIASAGDPTASSSQTRPRRPKTINNILSTLRSILYLAFDYELIDRIPRIQLERDIRPEPSFLDFGETEALLAASAPEWRTMLLVAVRTGLRRGELLELRWRDLDLDGECSQVRVTRSVRFGKGGTVTIKEPKSGRGRTVPLVSAVAAALRAQRGAARSVQQDELVFAGEEGRHRSPDQLYRAVIAAGQRAGLKRHVHPHELRHSFASHCYIRGVAPQLVQRWLGHSSITTTERYAHLRVDENASKTLEAVFAR